MANINSLESQHRLALEKQEQNHAIRSAQMEQERVTHPDAQLRMDLNYLANRIVTDPTFGNAIITSAANHANPAVRAYCGEILSLAIAEELKIHGPGGGLFATVQADANAFAVVRGSAAWKASVDVGSNPEVILAAAVNRCQWWAKFMRDIANKIRKHFHLFAFCCKFKGFFRGFFAPTNIMIDGYHAKGLIGIVFEDGG